jgi:hypothetical protein
MNGYVALGLALGVLSGCNLELKTVPAPVPSSTAISIEPREQLLPTYPCSGCHADRQPRQEKYTLKEFHAVRNSDFSHGEDAFWCYQCHAVKNIDKLTTSTGELVSFNEAYKLCTSCHGDKLEPWRSGTHGLILGDWNGVKHKKSCPACHDPHQPRFPAIRPEAPPPPAKGLKAL